MIPQSKKAIACAIVSILATNILVLPMDKLSSSCPQPTTIGTWKLPKTKSMTFPPAGKRSLTLTEEFAQPLLDQIARENQTDQQSTQKITLIEETAPLGFQREHSRSFATATDFDDSEGSLATSESNEKISQEKLSCLEKFLTNYDTFMRNRCVNIATGVMGAGTVALSLLAIINDDRSGLFELIFVGEAITILQGFSFQGLQKAIDILNAKKKNQSKLDLLNEPDIENNIQSLTTQPRQKAEPKCKQISNVLLNNVGYITSAFTGAVAILTLWDWADPDFDAPNEVYAAEAASGAAQIALSTLIGMKSVVKEKIEARQKLERTRRGTGVHMELNGRDISFARLPDIREMSSRGSCELYGQTLGALDQGQQLQAIQEPLLSESTAIAIPNRES